MPQLGVAVVTMIRGRTNDVRTIGGRGHFALVAINPFSAAAQD